MNFSDIIIHWYTQNSRELPWRNTKNPYYIWLSEIILQQTRVSQGLPYYLKFIKAFPTIYCLAKANQSSILKMWQGLGYYSRARNLHFTAKYIAYNLQGKFPSSYADLRSLKGIGDYTASAITSICFDKPTAVVDGNVYRVLSRYFGIKTAINSSSGIKEFKALAQTLIDKTQPGIFNQAIMDFGALHCKPQNPLCKSCPLANTCVALEKKIIGELPIKERKLKIKNRFFNYLVAITEDQKTMLPQQKGKGIWQGMHQFPLIETQEKIDKKTLVLSKEFNQLFPLKTNIILFNKKDIIHKLSHQHLHTQFWIVQIEKISEPSIPWKDIYKYPVPVLIANFLKEYHL